MVAAAAVAATVVAVVAVAEEERQRARERRTARESWCSARARLGGLLKAPRKSQTMPRLLEMKTRK